MGYIIAFIGGAWFGMYVMGVMQISGAESRREEQIEWKSL